MFAKLKQKTLEEKQPASPRSLSEEQRQAKVNSNAGSKSGLCVTV